MVTPARAPQPARTLCATILAQWLETGDFPDRMLPHEHPASALIQEIVYGSVRWYGALKWRIDTFTQREPDMVSMGFLLAGFYQIFHMDHIPPHAVVNETIEAAKRNLDPARCRFLNAVLRNALRQKEHLEKAFLDAPDSVRWSHPPVVVERWKKAYGSSATEALCHWDNLRPRVSLRIFGDHPDAEALKLRVTPHPASPSLFFLAPSGTPVDSLPGFATGAFYVQDPATEIAVQLLDPRPGMKLLDACAAPGGKAFACAARMQQQGQIIALDRHIDRLERLSENSKRMRCEIIKIQRADATQPDQLPQGTFDRILLDVPCSNSGVLQRRPDARWRLTEDRIRELAALQTRFLDAAAPLLAPDGILVYSTCSLETEENEQCVEKWIARNPDFKITDIQKSLPPGSGMDGAFAARIEKRQAK